METTDTAPGDTADTVLGDTTDALAVRDKLERNIAALSEQIDSVVIVDDETRDGAATLLGMAHSTLKKSEDEMKTATKPMNEALKVVRSWWKPRLDKLTAIKGQLKQKIIVYEQEQMKADAAKRQAERDARLAAVAEMPEQMQDDAVDRLAKDEAAEETVKRPTVRGSLGGTVSVSKRWVFEVEDIGALVKAAVTYPDLIGFLCVDEKAVRAAIKNRLRDCPGLRIYEEDTASVR